MKGDPVLLRKTKAEHERIKGQTSKDQPDTATYMLNLTEVCVVLAESNQELERLLLEQQERSNKSEKVLRENGEELDKALADSKQLKSETSGLNSSLIVLEE